MKSPKRKWKPVIWVSLSILLAVFCMVLPGTVVQLQAENNIQVVHQAPGAYNYSSGQMIVQMTLYERMKLISGEWESNWQQVEQDSVRSASTMPVVMYTVPGQTGDNQLEGYCYLDYQSVLECAQAGLNELYEMGIYPEEAKSTYNNWYRPEVSLYQYTDSVFNSYTCYVWLVELDYYDGSFSHILLIDDTSGIILAAGLREEEADMNRQWIREMDTREDFTDVLNYYRTVQDIQSALDITGTDFYQPHYELWNEKYNLNEAQLAGTALGLNQKQLLFSSHTYLTSYEAALKEVKGIVNNDKFVYSVYWNDRECWFYLTPFTVRLEKE